MSILETLIFLDTSIFLTDIFSNHFKVLARRDKFYPTDSGENMELILIIIILILLPIGFVLLYLRVGEILLI